MVRACICLALISFITSHSRSHIGACLAQLGMCKREGCLTLLKPHNLRGKEGSLWVQIVHFFRIAQKGGAETFPTFPSTHMYFYIPLVQRKVALYYHYMDRRRKYLIFSTNSYTSPHREIFWNWNNIFQLSGHLCLYTSIILGICFNKEETWPCRGRLYVFIYNVKFKKALQVIYI